MIDIIQRLAKKSQKFLLFCHLSTSLLFIVSCAKLKKFLAKQTDFKNSKTNRFQDFLAKQLHLLTLNHKTNPFSSNPANVLYRLFNPFLYRSEISMNHRSVVHGSAPVVVICAICWWWQVVWD